MILSIHVLICSAIVKTETQEIEDLIEALQDEDWNVRVNATMALGQIGPDAKDAVPALIPLLKGQNEGVRKSAMEALKVIESRQ